MAALNLNANLPVYIQWPDDAALTLIQRRRAYQPLFTTTRPTRKQCREKWNALKAGYENLERLINRNPDDYLLVSRLCMTRGSTKNSQTSSGELSVTLVRSSQRNRVDRRTYEYRERRRSRRSRFQSPYHHRERGRSHSRSHRHRRH
ncbi:hypothetical protein GLOIN_2v1789989 [Rhizophagus irregularis DAOM 181602=DAOM 197198]|nr:hypothetical protein GLOIN_2v1789989 [Rhizophagus irregularis DAOM 181602=DAOM 197198]